MGHWSHVAHLSTESSDSQGVANIEPRTNFNSLGRGTIEDATHYNT